jgi:2-oxoglutarate ferredoxin oxidoreductase subunit gamma
VSEERYRLVFCGAGGQGVITASIVLAEAAVFHEGWNAVQTQSYGPEARGSTTRSDLILSPEAINYPKVLQPNILVCLTQDAYNRYHSVVRPGGLLLTDNHFVKQLPTLDARQMGFPMYSSVLERLGAAQPLNICMLGALVAVTRIVREESLLEALARRFQGESAQVNLRALEIGRELARGHSWG